MCQDYSVSICLNLEISVQLYHTVKFIFYPNIYIAKPACPEKAVSE